MKLGFQDFTLCLFDCPSITPSIDHIACCVDLKSIYFTQGDACLVLSVCLCFLGIGLFFFFIISFEATRSYYLFCLFSVAFALLLLTYTKEKKVCILPSRLEMKSALLH